MKYHHILLQTPGQFHKADAVMRSTLIGYPCSPALQTRSTTMKPLACWRCSPASHCQVFQIVILMYHHIKMTTALILLPLVYSEANTCSAIAIFPKSEETITAQSFMSVNRHSYGLASPSKPTHKEESEPFMVFLGMNGYGITMDWILDWCVIQEPSTILILSAKCLGDWSMQQGLLSNGDCWVSLRLRRIPSGLVWEDTRDGASWRLSNRGVGMEAFH